MLYYLIWQLIYTLLSRPFHKFLVILCLQADAGFPCPVKYYTPGHAFATSANVMAHKIPMPQKMWHWIQDLNANGA